VGLPLPERLLIARLANAVADNAKSASRERLASKSDDLKVVTGIGDDCAVLRLRQTNDILVTTDFTLENVHFRREWHSPESVGHRCLVRGLSDIAAMGGRPSAAFLSLAVPPKLPQSWVDRFFRGLLKLARESNVTLSGGDTSRSPSKILADVIVLGCVPKGTAVLRSGARPGDRIYATGAIGGSAATLSSLYSSKRKGVNSQLSQRYFFPEPRIRVGQILRQKKIPSSMIDLSDGLSTDLSHLCEDSGVGAEIWAASIPRAVTGKSAKPIALDLALHGGEDYELLFTASPRQRVPPRVGGVAVSYIGEITSRKQISLIHQNGSSSLLEPRGWEHFRRRDS
jgi:thiamine-monophosphate kinase